MKIKDLIKKAYQETVDEAFLYNHKPDKKEVSTPLPGVKLTEGLSRADIDTDNTSAVTNYFSDVTSKYKENVDTTLPPEKTAMAHFYEGFFGKAKTEAKKKPFFDNVPVFSNKGGAAEFQKGPPTMFSPGYDVGGGV